MQETAGGPAGHDPDRGETEEDETGQEGVAPPPYPFFPDARPEDQIPEGRRPEGQAGHERREEEADLLVEDALLRLVGEDEDRFADDAEKSGDGGQEPPSPGGPQAASEKQERQADPQNPPDFPEPLSFRSETGQVRKRQPREEPREPGHHRIGVADRPDVGVFRNRRFFQAFLHVGETVVREEVPDVGRRDEAGLESPFPEAVGQDFRRPGEGGGGGGDHRHGPREDEDLRKDRGEGAINARRPACRLGRPEVLGGGETQRDDSAGMETCGALGEEFPRVEAVRLSRRRLRHADEDQVPGKTPVLQETPRIGPGDADGGVRSATPGSPRGDGAGEG